VLSTIVLIFFIRTKEVSLSNLSRIFQKRSFQALPLEMRLERLSVSLTRELRRSGHVIGKCTYQSTETKRRMMNAKLRFKKRDSKIKIAVYKGIVFNCIEHDLKKNRKVPQDTFDLSTKGLSHLEQ
jgi:hypothetical protein